MPPLKLTIQSGSIQWNYQNDGSTGALKVWTDGVSASYRPGEVASFRTSDSTGVIVIGEVPDLTTAGVEIGSVIIQ